MSNSLSDQLLKAGLVTEEQVKKAQEKPKRTPQKPKKKAAKGKKRPTKAKQPVQQEPELSAEERAAIKAHKQKIREFLREHRLNKQQLSEEVKKAQGKLEEPDKDTESAESAESEPSEAPKETGPVADIKYHFQLAGRTHHLYVTQDQRQGLIAGELSILLRNERYYLLTAGDSATMRELDPQSLFFTASGEDEQTSDENDPYADFKVPDDLTW